VVRYTNRVRGQAPPFGALRWQRDAAEATTTRGAVPAAAVARRRRAAAARVGETAHTYRCSRQPREPRPRPGAAVGYDCTVGF